MATSREFARYICEQMSGAGEIIYKKMFGEYGIYCEGKFFGCICNNQFFVKITKGVEKWMPDHEKGSPYEGAKPHFLIMELEDKAFLKELVQRTCSELPMPKPKKKII